MIITGQWALAQMPRLLQKRTRWRARSWVQDPLIVCVTYQEKHNDGWH